MVPPTPHRASGDTSKYDISITDILPDTDTLVKDVLRQIYPVAGG
jgi:hypothetical protein